MNEQEIPRLVEIEQELVAWKEYGDMDIFTGADETIDDLLTLLNTERNSLAGWADWFEYNASHVGGRQSFTADEVAALLRGPKPFGASGNTETKEEQS